MLNLDKQTKRKRIELTIAILRKRNFYQNFRVFYEIIAKNGDFNFKIVKIFHKFVQYA
jgi:hypothetical protein